jgi:trehalose 6-phosphate synthase/phosphatase
MHVGVDLPSVESVLSSSEFEKGAFAWKNRFPGKIVFCGIDRLERLKGVPMKLLGIEQFLQDNPDWKDDVVFTILGVSAKERGNDYRQTLSDVKLLVARINRAFGSVDCPAVYFEERSDRELGLMERLSYFAAGDVLLNTAVRDGLNRLPMEFTLARVAFGKCVEKRGIPYEQIEGAGLPSQNIIIISEFVSAARVMRGGLIINPWSDRGIQTSILRSLIMNPIERADRMRRNVEYSTRLTTANWATHVLYDLKCVEKSQDHTEYSAFGLGMGFRMMGVKSGFQTVDTKAVCRAYRESRKRLILLDWGGTLVPEETKNDNMAAYTHAHGLESRGGPSKGVIDTIANLCTDPKNCVFVISGKDILSVSEYFGEVSGLGLGAEHGFYYRWPAKGETSNNLRWQQMVTGPEATNQPWKEPARMVMDIFTQRTHGTYVEAKGNALIWQYRDADPEFGYLQSREIEEHLTAVLVGFAVEVIRGGSVSDGYIEVRPRGVSKGLFLKHALESLKVLARGQDDKVEFVLAVGDDASDEPMFEQINSLLGSGSNIQAFGVTVGKKPTAAMSYVDDSAAVLELLNTLTKSSQRDKRYFSSVDLAAKLPGNPDGMRTSNHRSTPPSLMRAASDSDLSRANPEGLREFNPSFTASIMPKVTSVVDISMTEYLTKIDEGEDDENDGIFF